jgi:curli biogenesis system outer membrane secretion channel CsgG
MNRRTLRLLPFGSLAVLALAAACATHRETAGRDALTVNVGVYPPPPSGVQRPRIGVPQFLVTTQPNYFPAATDPNTLAADQMTTLLSLSDRFQVIERGQLDQLLKEQDLEGIVKPGELAKPGQVRGVDYLLIGKVTNLRVKSERSGTAFGTGGILSGLVPVGDLGIAKSNVMISTDCGVDIRLVDPTSGEVAVANFGEFKRTDSAAAIGVSVGAARAGSSADVEISDDDKGKILRLALDDALRKTIPKIDALLASRFRATAAPAAAPSAPAATGAAPDGTAAPTAAAFCPQCGRKLTAGAKFCPGCGAKIE